MASRLIQVATALLFSSALIQAQATVVNEQSITDPDTEWLSYGRNYKEQRFSPLDKINRDNVDELDLAWSFKFDTARGMEATPLMHDGVLYVSTGWAHVHALDARTGEELWHFDAEVPREHLIKACCGAVNRGVAMWQGDEETGLQVFCSASSSAPKASPYRPRAAPAARGSEPACFWRGVPKLGLRP